MNLVHRLLAKAGSFNPSTLSGAIDVLVVEQPDGSLRGSPFHARFGKRHVLRPRDNLVELHVNDLLVSGLAAKLGSAGEVYFCSAPSGANGACTECSASEEPSHSSGQSVGQSNLQPPPDDGPMDPTYALTDQKCIQLSSEQLRLLRLRPGSNKLQYCLTTKNQGIAYCSCAIYLWRHDDRIVVSDIDGTITRSDLLGQLLPIVGKDWTQPTVVRLFSQVQRNGYRFLYLSARGLGQSEATRRCLEQVSQDGAALPDGPVLLSPVSLLRALHREVIARRPQEFKTPCLRSVRAMFPSGSPFWAGFGNRPSDSATYAEVGVPADRCFTVNRRGELLREDPRAPAAVSYRKLADVADQVFPRSALLRETAALTSCADALAPRVWRP